MDNIPKYQAQTIFMQTGENPEAKFSNPKQGDRTGTSLRSDIISQAKTPSFIKDNSTSGTSEANGDTITIDICRNGQAAQAEIYGRFI